ncbi:GGDEF domain-containing protein [Thalassolituus sp. LLYu03]|uniref:GGDEF domain-containing protein n=1 Tax=Thalassolituus sp. LLYu03 TaxID=3421656 RepID=UPI003D2A1A42
MNLKPRILLLTAVLMVLSAAGIWFLSQQVTMSVLKEWALKSFETQVKLEKERALQPIIREVALARQLANSQMVRNWALDEHNAAKKQAALTELEAYRHNFADHSYFVALLSSGDYYHNNAANEYAGQEYRYSLRSDNPDDRWFYSIINQNRDIHLNVNPDIPLKVTKLWIDVLLRDGDRILGVIGTGLDLSDFIRQFSTAPEPGVHNLFFDHEGAVQMSADISQIDFNSITKAAAERKTIWQLLGGHDSETRIRQVLASAMAAPGSVISTQLLFESEEHLAGVIYLPEVDWYVMTLLEPDTLLPLSTFNRIFLLAGFSIFVSLLLFNLVLNRQVMRPLAQLENAIDTLRAGKPVDSAFPDHTQGEVGRLMKHFIQMGDEVLEARERLETRVRQRTEELEKQTLTDPVTGLLNRRGMMQQLELEMARLEREHTPFGILWLDLDGFKVVNDAFGHNAGDTALESTAHIIRSHIRPYDFASRWGGDEFLLLIKTNQQPLLDQLGRRLCAAVRELELHTDQGERLPVTISAGSKLAQPGTTLTDLLAAADQAMYQAKEAGRDRYLSG